MPPAKKWTVPAKIASVPAKKLLAFLPEPAKHSAVAGKTRGEKWTIPAKNRRFLPLFPSRSEGSNATKPTQAFPLLVVFRPAPSVLRFLVVRQQSFSTILPAKSEELVAWASGGMKKLIKVASSRRRQHRHRRGRGGPRLQPCPATERRSAGHRRACRRRWRGSAWCRWR